MEYKDIELVSNNEIKRGKIFWSAIPFSEQRPLIIYDSIKNASYTGKIHEENNLDFNSINERKQSNEIDVIIRHKRRMALIVQNDKFNNDADYPFVYVIPITTFGGNKEKINYVKNNPELPNFHYLGNLTGKESVINISDIKRIHKSLLLEDSNFKINDDGKIMIDVCKKIGYYMNIQQIEKCKECKYNYENYIKIEDKLVKKAE
ncbi:type II toxin-antitoxin system PemK/MazF family toxin [Clostridium sp. KNHs214]|uniref:type II toxin-antitoxin system PemK/MazF family toxin n=1 Tax=Clostridium sp. KNHs214 TaxID=1540257 RepID=UPI0005567C5D|nr:type II toxin-antitoxin system PemK/MazF family toxin [Clostridium sp. KNHs214]